MKETGGVRPFRVLVVDDSAFMRTALSRMISCEAGFEVVGTASSGADALGKVAALDPDVVTLDVEMPGMDGLTTLRSIMREAPRPVIMVSAGTKNDAEVTFDALSAGAFDCVPKQLSSSSLEIAHIRSDLIGKIRAAAQSRKKSFSNVARKPVASSTLKTQHAVFASSAVAIGSSTGGPKALEEILLCLPHDFPVPILIVQHMPAGFTTSFAQRLNKLCAIDIHEAVQNELVRPGVAYISPSCIHMRVQPRPEDSRIIISLDRQPADAVHIPSIDVLMESVAKVYRSCAMGVILTGMGADGAAGMNAIYHQGGLTIGQDQASCAVYGMPRACADLGVLTRVVPLSEIAMQIMQATRRRRPA